MLAVSVCPAHRDLIKGLGRDVATAPVLAHVATVRCISTWPSPLPGSGMAPWLSVAGAVGSSGGCGGSGHPCM